MDDTSMPDTMSATDGVLPRTTRRFEPRTAADVVDSVLHGERTASGRHREAIPTGFEPLDHVLGGGLQINDLLLIGGLPGVGKTIAALQMARHVAMQGRPALYICYEHDAYVLLGRLLALELGEGARDEDLPHLELLRGEALQAIEGRGDLAHLWDREPVLADALRRLSTYADDLWLVGASGAHTGLAEITALVRDSAARGVVFVDYLQKVAVRPEPASEADKVTRIAEGLKDLALSNDVPVVAIVAADRAALDAPRLRLHHLRGSSALAYESDVAVLLNPKYGIVAKSHITYDTVRAQTFHNYVVFSVEKNRGGPAQVDLEFRKNFAHYRFDTAGGYVTERLVDERINVE